MAVLDDDHLRLELTLKARFRDVADDACEAWRLRLLWNGHPLFNPEVLGPSRDDPRGPAGVVLVEAEGDELLDALEGWAREPTGGTWEPMEPDVALSAQPGGDWPGPPLDMDHVQLTVAINPYSFSPPSDGYGVPHTGAVLDVSREALAAFAAELRRERDAAPLPNPVPRMSTPW